MRTLAIGDIHGGLRALPQLLERAHVTANDKLIFLGDYVDGWSESAQVIQYLIDLSKKNQCVFIKGNHDVWCEDWLRTDESDSVWLSHGGEGTKESYSSFSKKEKQQHLRFFEDMELYHVDDNNRLFIHAGFTSMHGVESEYNFRNFYFDRTLWEMALTMDKRITKDSSHYPNRLKHYHEIYIGHTPTLNYHKYQPMNAINVWDVDTGAAFTGSLSAIDVDTKEVFQSDTLPMLYPNENGRN
ncbi:metallophosphoesterase [Winogradskyella ursingii]|uniref:metallophosphoesterase n=1 Tax=Winogradskyella ursingii TaxID=2686079 RepID=UPI0015C831A4|nr:metallophosphoesterase [Winogradskyella ursingii]